MARVPTYGQEWRLRNGSEVIVEDVEGKTVHGAERPVAITSSGRAAGTVGIAVFAGSVDEFDGAVLIGPRWHVKLTAPSTASHPSQDPVFDAIAATGEIEHVSRPVVATDAQGGLNAHEATYDVFVLAVNDADASGRILRAVEAAGQGHATILEVDRAPNL